jgi:hypothetical protein
MGIGLAGILGLLLGVVLGAELHKRRRLSFISRYSRYAIAIYTGDSPCDLRPAIGVPCPVLTAADVTDLQAQFVADPFMVLDNGKWYMFFEVMDATTDRGVIGLARSDDCSHWTYERVVLQESLHLSYPYVFEWENTYYMTPASPEAGAVRLYKALEFPGRWEHVRDLIQGGLRDPSPFRFRDRWWMLATSPPDIYGVLRLFSSDTLTGEWKEHPKSPVVAGDRRLARPAGRILLLGDRVIRFAQDCKRYYGRAVRAFEITKLTPTEYEERPIGSNPILGPAWWAWNSKGMHAIDVQQLSDGKWIACVDGKRSITRVGVFRG